MSNIFRYALPAISHYQIPHALDKWLNSISIEELRLLHLVHSEAEKTSLSEVVLSTDVICARTGIHKTNIGKARQGLVDYGLLLVRVEGRQYSYIVCDPEKKEAVSDRNSLKDIDFSHVSANVLTSYIQAILKGSKITKEGVSGHCPFLSHNDSTASFTMDVNKGGKWWCRGCGKAGSLIALEIYLSENAVGVAISPDKAHTVVRDKLRALGLGKRATGKPDRNRDVVYAYVNEGWEVITETVRLRGNKKNTVRRHPHPTIPGKYVYDTDGCRNVLYNLPRIIEAGTILIVEGEPDADRLSKLGLKDDIGDLVAVTTNACGAGNFLPEHAIMLRDKRVILCGDNDDNGRGLKHMLQVKDHLEAVGVKALIHIQLPSEYRDVSHYLEFNRPRKFVDLVGDDWLEPIEDGIVDI